MKPVFKEGDFVYGTNNECVYKISNITLQTDSDLCCDWLVLHNTVVLPQTHVPNRNWALATETQIAAALAKRFTK